MKRILSIVAMLLLLPLSSYSQSVPQHQMYVKIGSEKATWTEAYTNWIPGNESLYQNLDEEAAENEQFFISRIKPRTRFTNSFTQVRVTQNPERKFLWWCPIGGDGWNALPSYFFGGEVWTMWSYTDIWGNWTAPFMSMPAAMLDVCHKNGVKISCVAPISWASYLTPTSEGYGEMLARMLIDGPDKFLKYLKYYGIDGIGWNSEFDFSRTKLMAGPYIGKEFHTATKLFFGDLYEKAETYGVPFHNCWYSMMHNLGTMPASSNLDATNKDWFDYEGKPTSTAYFTNYGSYIPTSEQTVNLHFPNRSSFDVYFGVDYQAGTALSQWKELNSYKLSIGIWGAHNRNQIYETRGENGSDPVTMQKTYQKILENVFTGSTKNPINPPEITSTTRFNSRSTDAYGWAQYIVARSTLTPQDGGDLSTDPFVTNFNLGNGKFFNKAGERQSNTDWYNIGMQDFMPTWRWWATNTYMGRTAEEVSDDLTAEFIWDDAWLGGSCLQISGATEQTYLQLFKTKYSTANSGDYMTIRYKVLSGSGTLSWACSKEGDEATAVERVIKTNATVESGDEDANGWVTSSTQISGRQFKLNNTTIAQVGLKFTNTTDNFKVLIGQISLTRGQVGSAPKPQTPLVEKSKVMARNYKGVDMKIIYNMDGAYTGPEKELYEPVYNKEVNTSYFLIYTQQQGCDAKVFSATTSWAAYVVSAPYDTELGGDIRIGVAAVSLDGETESNIAWGEWIDVESIEPTIVEGTEIDKPIIKAGEEFTLRYIDINHPAATWEVINSQTGASVQTFTNTTSITLSLPTVGLYDVKITNGDGTVAFTRGIIQVSPNETGAIPTIGTLTLDKTETHKDENVTLSYTTSRLGEGSVSRAVKVEDPNLLRFPEVVASRPYTYMMWFKVDKFTHDKEGTNLIDKRSFSDVWPHNNWGDFWVTIRPDLEVALDEGTKPRKETGSSSTTLDTSTKHLANEISYNTYGWTEHDAPDTDMMSKDHSVKEGQWTHVAITFASDGTQKMYFNGKKVAEKVTKHIASNAVRWPGSYVYIGGTSVYKGGYNGWVDEFQVWDRVLTDQEVQEAMKGYTTAPNGLQGYWTFEEQVPNANGDMVFPNLGYKGDSYTAALISTIGQSGENTSSVTETILNASNDELGNPMISGTYQVKTESEWNFPNASIESQEGTTATISYDVIGTYTAGLTLKNMWGKDTQSVEIAVISWPDGVEDAVIEGMGVYPNPFTDFINMSFVKEGLYTIEIVALDGKLIESKQINVTTNECVRVDVDGEKGMYIIKVKNNNGTAVRSLKVIKR